MVLNYNKDMQKDSLPISVSLYDGEISYNVLASDCTKSPKTLKTEEVSENENMLRVMLYNIIINYNHYTIYIHNLSHLNSMFLSKVLKNFFDNVKPIIENDIITGFNCSMIYEEENIYIEFRDSSLILSNN